MIPRIADRFHGTGPVDFVRAEPADAALLADIDRLAFAHPWPRSEFDRVTRSSSDQAYVALNEGAAVGCYVLRDARKIDGGMHVDSMAVIPAAQGRKIGEQLLLHAMQQARQSGAARCYLEVDVTNVPAKHLYEKTGFVDDERLPGYYADDGHDGMRMVLDDLQSPQTAARLQAQKQRMDAMLAAMHPYPCERAAAH